MKLWRKSVYRVYEEVDLICTKHLPRLLGFEILLYYHEVKFGIDVHESLSEYLAFWSADCRVKGKKLTVLVGD